MKFLIYGAGIWLVFTVFVTVFAASARSTEVRNLPKWAWVLLCLFIPFVGGLLYLFLGRPLPKPEEFNRGRGGSRTRTTIAPDDDPEFLRRLAKRLKNEKKDSGESDDPKGNDLPNV